MIKEIIKDPEKLTKTDFYVVQKNQDIAISLTQDLGDTLMASGRVYLCSNELGYHERAFAIKFADDWEIFMNPMLNNKTELRLIRETDPLTGKEFIVPRFTDLAIFYQDSLGKSLSAKFTPEASIVACQAMDMLDGIHPADYGLEVLPEFDEATDEEREQLINQYLEELIGYRDVLDKELTEDSETSKPWMAAKFLRAKAAGEVETELVEVNHNRKWRRAMDKLIRRLTKNASKSKQKK